MGAKASTKTLESKPQEGGVDSGQIVGDTDNNRWKAGAEWLFGTYEGLVTSLIFFILGIICFLGSFSEPMVMLFGRPLLPIHLEDADKVSRIVMLYHALAIPFVTAVVFFVMKYYPVRERWENSAKWNLYVGSLITGVTGITFAYIIQGNWVVHGLFLLGMSLVAYGSVQFIIGIWPTKNWPVYPEEEKRPKIKNWDLEQFNMSLVTLALIISAVIGAIPAAHFGNGYEAELAESIVREEHDLFQRMVVSHLHIMVALLDAAVMLLVYRYTDVKGKLFNIGQWLTIPGVVIMSSGAWLVITDWESSHKVINVGAMFLLSSALILAYLGWRKTSQYLLGDKYSTSGIWRKVTILFIDPIKSGIYFQFVLVNAVVTVPGVWVAIHLEQYRTLEYLEVEYSFNVGHWHILVTLTAIIIFLMTIDILDIRGKLRSLIGWTMSGGATFAFIFATAYTMRDPSSDGFTEFMFVDVGLMVTFVGIFAFAFLKLLDFWQARLPKKPVESVWEREVPLDVSDPFGDGD